MCSCVTTAEKAIIASLQRLISDSRHRAAVFSSFMTLSGSHAKSPGTRFPAIDSWIAGIEQISKTPHASSRNHMCPDVTAASCAVYELTSPSAPAPGARKPAST